MDTADKWFASAITFFFVTMLALVLVGVRDSTERSRYLEDNKIKACLEQGNTYAVCYQK